MKNSFLVNFSEVFFDGRFDFTFGQSTDLSETVNKIVCFLEKSQDTNLNLKNDLSQAVEQNSKNSKTLVECLINNNGNSSSACLGVIFSAEANQQFSGLCRFLKKQDEIIFLVYNTSIGLDYHSSEINAQQQLCYLPVYGFSFPTKENDGWKERLVDVIDKCRNNFFEDSKKFYQKLPDIITFLSGKEIKVDTYARQYITPNYRGACLFGAVSQLIKNNYFSTEKDFTLFLFHYRLFLFKSLIDKVETKILYGRDFLLQRALRVLTEMTIDSCLADKKDDLQEALSPYKYLYSALPSSFGTTAKTDNKLHHSTLKAENSVSQDLRFNKRLEAAPNTEDFFEAKADFKEYMEKLLEITKSTKKLNQSFITLTLIEKFCIKFCNTDNTIEFSDYSKTSDNLMEIFKCYNHLQNNEVTPRTVIINLSFICLLDRVAEKEGLTLACLYCKKILELLHNAACNPFLGTQDPQLDLLWEKIAKFYTGFEEQKELTYLLDFIKKNIEKNEKQHLDSYQTPKEYQRKISYLKNKQRTQEEKEKLQAIFDADEKLLYYLECDNKKRDLIAEKLNRKFLNLSKLWNNTLTVLKSSFKTHKNNSLEDIQPKNQISYSISDKLEINSFYTIENNFLVARQLLKSWNIKFDQIEPYKNLLMNFDGNSPSSNEISRHTTDNLIINQSCKGYDDLIDCKERSKRIKDVFLKEINEVPAGCRKDSLELYAFTAVNMQVMLLLTQMPSSIDTWSDPLYQQKIMLSIFAPRALLSAIKLKAPLWDILDDLMSRVQFKDPSYSKPEEWFILRLAAAISDYSIKYFLLTGQKSFDGRIYQWQKKMWIAAKLKLQNPDSTANDRMLRLYRMQATIHLKESSKNDDIDDQELLKYFLEDYLTAGASSGCASCPAEEERLHTLFAGSYGFLNSFFDKESINNALKELLVKLPIFKEKITSLTEEQASENFQNKLLNFLVPNTENHYISVNLQTAAIFYNAKKIMHLPRKICQLAEYKELFGSKIFQVMHSMTQYGQYNCYEWSYQQQEYQISHTTENENNYYLQRKINDKWAVLQCHNSSYAEKIGFCPKNTFKNNLPKLWKESGVRFWVMDSDNYQVTDREFKKLYCVSDGCLLDNAGKKVSFIQKPNVFLSFEDINFIIQVANTVKLPRYSLEFTFKDGEYVDNNDFQVAQQEKHYFSSGLLLSKDNTQKLLIPVQPFVVNNESGCIEHELNEETSIIIGSYNNTQEYLEVKIEENNYLSSIKNPLQIYLIYFLINNGRYQEAFNKLNDYVLTGDQEEIKYLWWIIKKLPTSESEGVHPEVLSIQLLALYHLIVLRLQFNILPEFSSRFKIDSCFYLKEQKEFGNLLTFWKEIHQYVIDIYERIVQYKYIPEVMTLTQDKINYLAVYCQKMKFDGYENKISLKKLYIENFIQKEQSIDVTSHQISCKENNLEESNLEHSHYCHYAYGLTWQIEREACSLKEAYDNIEKLEISSNFDFIKKNFYSIILVSKDRSDNKKAARNKIKNICKMVANNEKFYSDAIFFYTFIWGILHMDKDTLEKIPPIKIEKNLTGYQVGQSKEKYLKIFINKLELLISEIPKITSMTWGKLEIRKKISHELSSQQRGTTNSGFFGIAQDLFKSYAIKLIGDCKFDQLISLEKKYEENKKKVLSSLDDLNKCNYQEKSELLHDIDLKLLTLQQEKQKEQSRLISEHDINTTNIDNVIHEINKNLSNNKQKINEILEKSHHEEVIEFIKQTKPVSLERIIKFGFTEVEFEEQEELEQIKNETDQLKSNQNTLNCFNKIKEILSNSNDFSQIIKILVSTKQPSHPAMRLFQYQNNISLRPEQIELLEAIINHFKDDKDGLSIAVQIIMGGGKSSVFLPLLSHISANGNLLPIIAVPKDSLNNTYYHLANTNQEVFMQNVMRLTFERNSPRNTQDLQCILDSLKNAVRYKNCITTTITTLQTFYLLLIELLFDRRNQKKENNTEQLNCLIKLLLFLKNHGMLVVDESHDLLDCDKELNFTYGKKEKINSYVLKTLIKLYYWMLSIKITIDSHEYNLMNFLENPEILSEEKTFMEVINQYVNQYVDNDKSKNLLINELTINELKKYLLCDTTPSEELKINNILKTNLVVCNKWYLLRSVFSNLLKVTLLKKLKTDYGNSTDVNNLCAIPWVNNAPTKNSYGDPYIKIMLTIQMTLLQGITFSAFYDFLKKWKNIQNNFYDSELERNNNIEEVEKKYRSIFSDASNHNFSSSLKNLEINNKIKLAEMHEKYKKSPVLIKHFLQEFLQNLSYEKTTLRSGSYTPVKLTKQTIAISGTCEHSGTYHYDINTWQESKFLSSSLIFDELKKKNTPLISMPAKNKNIDKFIEEYILTNADVRALIDCSGFFISHKNSEIAKKIKEKLNDTQKNTQITGIKYILYYQDNSWYALSTTSEEKIRLISTGERYLQSQITCSRMERFVLYGQGQCSNVDIEHEDKHTVCAVVTLEKSAKTDIINVAQAVSRLRGITRKQMNQRIVFVLSEMLARSVTSPSSSNTSPNLNLLQNHLRQQSDKNIHEKRSRVAPKKIDDFYHYNIWWKLINTPINKIDDFFNKNFHYFIVNQNQDQRLEEHGMRYQPKKTKTVIEQRSKQHEKYFLNNGLSFDAKKIQEIISEEAQHSLNEINSADSDNANREIEQENKVEIEIQLDHVGKPVEYTYINQLISLETESLFKKTDDLSRNFSTINCLLNNNRLTSRHSINFSDSLGVTKNFFHHFYNDTNNNLYHDKMKKPFAVYFRIDKDKRMHALILCQEEAGKFLDHCISDKSHNNSQWISTFSAKGHAYHEMPELNEEQKKEHRYLLAQAAFLFGEIDMLLEMQDFSFLDNPEKKFDFLYLISKNKPIFTEPTKIDFLYGKVIPISKFVWSWIENGENSTVVDVTSGEQEKFQKLYKALSLAKIKASNNQKINNDDFKISSKYFTEVIQYYNSCLFIYFYEKNKSEALKIFIEKKPIYFTENQKKECKEILLNNTNYLKAIEQLEGYGRSDLYGDIDVFNYDSFFSKFLLSNATATRKKNGIILYCHGYFSQDFSDKNETLLNSISEKTDLKNYSDARDFLKKQNLNTHDNEKDHVKEKLNCYGISQEENNDLLTNNDAFINYALRCYSKENICAAIALFSARKENLLCDIAIFSNFRKSLSQNYNDLKRIEAIIVLYENHLYTEDLALKLTENENFLMATITFKNNKTKLEAILVLLDKNKISEYSALVECDFLSTIILQKKESVTEENLTAWFALRSGLSKLPKNQSTDKLKEEYYEKASEDNYFSGALIKNKDSSDKCLTILKLQMYGFTNNYQHLNKDCFVNAINENDQNLDNNREIQRIKMIFLFLENDLKLKNTKVFRNTDFLEWVNKHYEELMRDKDSFIACYNLCDNDFFSNDIKKMEFYELKLASKAMLKLKNYNISHNSDELSNKNFIKLALSLEDNQRSLKSLSYISSMKMLPTENYSETTKLIGATLKISRTQDYLLDNKLKFTKKLAFFAIDINFSNQEECRNDLVKCSEVLSNLENKTPEFILNNNKISAFFAVAKCYLFIRKLEKKQLSTKMIKSCEKLLSFNFLDSNWENNFKTEIEDNFYQNLQGPHNILKKIAYIFNEIKILHIDPWDSLINKGKFFELSKGSDIDVSELEIEFPKQPFTAKDFHEFKTLGNGENFLKIFKDVLDTTKKLACSVNGLAYKIDKFSERVITFWKKSNYTNMNELSNFLLMCSFSIKNLYYINSLLLKRDIPQEKLNTDMGALDLSVCEPGVCTSIQEVVLALKADQSINNALVAAKLNITTSLLIDIVNNESIANTGTTGSAYFSQAYERHFIALIDHNKLGLSPGLTEDQHADTITKNASEKVDLLNKQFDGKIIDAITVESVINTIIVGMHSWEKGYIAQIANNNFISCGDIFEATDQHAVKHIVFLSIFYALVEQGYCKQPLMRCHKINDNAKFYYLNTYSLKFSHVEETEPTGAKIKSPYFEYLREKLCNYFNNTTKENQLIMIALLEKFTIETDKESFLTVFKGSQSCLELINKALEQRHIKLVEVLLNFEEKLHGSLDQLDKRRLELLLCDSLLANNGVMIKIFSLLYKKQNDEFNIENIVRKTKKFLYETQKFKILFFLLLYKINYEVKWLDKKEFIEISKNCQVEFLNIACDFAKKNHLSYGEMIISLFQNNEDQSLKYLKDNNFIKSLFDFFKCSKKIREDKLEIVKAAIAIKEISGITKTVPEQQILSFCSDKKFRSSVIFLGDNPEKIEACIILKKHQISFETSWLGSKDFLNLTLHSTEKLKIKSAANLAKINARQDDYKFISHDSDFNEKISSVSDSNQIKMILYSYRNNFSVRKIEKLLGNKIVCKNVKNSENYFKAALNLYKNNLLERNNKFYKDKDFEASLAAQQNTIAVVLLKNKLNTNPFSYLDKKNFKESLEVTGNDKEKISALINLAKHQCTKTDNEEYPEEIFSNRFFLKAPDFFEQDQKATRLCFLLAKAGLGGKIHEQIFSNEIFLALADYFYSENYHEKISDFEIFRLFYKLYRKEQAEKLLRNFSANYLDFFISLKDIAPSSDLEKLFNIYLVLKSSLDKENLKRFDNHSENIFSNEKVKKGFLALEDIHEKEKILSIWALYISGYDEGIEEIENQHFFEAVKQCDFDEVKIKKVVAFNKYFTSLYKGEYPDFLFLEDFFSNNNDCDGLEFKTRVLSKLSKIEIEEDLFKNTFFTEIIGNNYRKIYSNNKHKYQIIEAAKILAHLKLIEAYNFDNLSSKSSLIVWLNNNCLNNVIEYLNNQPFYNASNYYKGKNNSNAIKTIISLKKSNAILETQNVPNFIEEEKFQENIASFNENSDKIKAYFSLKEYCIDYEDNWFNKTPFVGKAASNRDKISLQAAAMLATLPDDQGDAYYDKVFSPEKIWLKENIANASSWQQAKAILLYDEYGIDLTSCDIVNDTTFCNVIEDKKNYLEAAKHLHNAGLLAENQSFSVLDKNYLLNENFKIAVLSLTSNAPALRALCQLADLNSLATQNYNINCLKNSDFQNYMSSANHENRNKKAYYGLMIHTQMTTADINEILSCEKFLAEFDKKSSDLIHDQDKFMVYVAIAKCCLLATKKEFSNNDTVKQGIETFVDNLFSFDFDQDDWQKKFRTKLLIEIDKNFRHRDTVINAILNIFAAITVIGLIVMTYEYYNRENHCGRWGASLWRSTHREESVKRIFENTPLSR